RRRHTRSKRDWSSDVCSSDLTPNATGLTLAQTRQMVADAVHVLTEHDARLSLIDGLEILPAADAHLLEDGLHPSTAGYAVMAERSEERRVGKGQLAQTATSGR